jgi:hypothetical protein
VSGPRDGRKVLTTILWSGEGIQTIKAPGSRRIISTKILYRPTKVQTRRRRVAVTESEILWQNFTSMMCFGIQHMADRRDVEGHETKTGC